MDNFFQRTIPQMAVKNGGSMTVSSNTEPLGHLKTVSGASLLVTSGGVVRDITNSGGTIVIAAGGTAYIDKGFIAENIDVAAGTAYISSGTLSGFSMPSNGGLIAAAGAASLLDTGVVSSGNFQLLSSARGSNIQLVNNGRGHVKQGAVLSGGSVAGSGNVACVLNISSGGTVCQLDVGPVGKLYTSDHAIVSSCVASGSGAAISILSSSHIGSLLKDCTGIDSGCLYVRGNGIAGSNLGVSGDRAAALYIWQPAAGQTVSAVHCSAVGGTIQVRSGGFLESGYSVSSGICFAAGGVVSNYSVYGQGVFAVTQGGYAEQIDITGGIVHISSGACSICTATCIGSDTTSGVIYISSGGLLSSATIGPNGKAYVYTHDAVVSDCIASGSGAVISILSSSYTGNLIKDCKALSSGMIYVRGNGIAGSNLVAQGNVSTRIYVQNPSAGTTVSAVNCSAVSRGRIYVSTGGVLSSAYTTVSGAIFLAKPRALADNVRMNGGYVSVYSGGTGHNITAAPGIVRVIGYNTSPSVVSGVSLGGNGTCAFYMNQNATDTASNGSCIAYDVTVTSGKSGSAMVKSGATVSGITVDDNTLNVLGGKVYLNSAGTGATINVGQRGSMGKHTTGGIIKGKVVLRAGYMESCTVGSGGTTTLFYDYADLASTVQSSSLASYTSVTSGGLLHVSSGCVASTVSISGGGVHIYSAGSITDVTFPGGGVLNLHGGFAVGVSGNGGVVVSSGAQASDISLQTSPTTPAQSGFAATYVYAGGSAENISLTGKATLYQRGGVVDYVSTVSLGNIRLYGDDNSPTTAKNVTVNFRGVLTVNEQVAAGSTGSSAIVSSTAVSGGTATIYDKGQLLGGSVESAGVSGIVRVSSGGYLSGLSILQGGYINIYPGGNAFGCVVSSGGTLTVSSGGTATDVVLNTGGVVDSKAGAVINYRGE